MEEDLPKKYKNLLQQTQEMCFYVQENPFCGFQACPVKRVNNR